VLVEFVEQLALDALTGHLAELALDLTANNFFQLVQRLKAKAGREFVVDLDVARGGDFLDLDIKGRSFAGKMCRRVVLGEAHFNDFCVAGFQTDKLLLEARNELTGTQNQLTVFVGAAIKGFAIDLAEVRHGHPVTVCSRTVLGVERCVVLGNVGNLCIDFLIRNLNDRPLDLKTGKVDDLEDRQNVIGHFEGQVGIARHDLFGFFFRKIDFRRQSRALGALFNSFLGGFLNGVRQDFRHGLTAIHLFQVSDRHFARTETFDVGLGLQVRHVVFKLGGKITSRNIDFELSLEALGEGFGYLHGFFRPRSRAAIRSGGFVLNPVCRAASTFLFPKAFQ